MSLPPGVEDREGRDPSCSLTSDTDAVERLEAPNQAAAGVAATPRPAFDAGVNEESKARLRGAAPCRPQLSEAMRGI